MSMAAGTFEYTLTQWHGLPMSTPAAYLTRIDGIDLDQLATSFCRFARQLREEGRPRSICNALGKTMKERA